MLKDENRISVLSIILLCGIALHYTIITIIIKDNLTIKFWKEIIIFLLLLETFRSQSVKDIKEKLYDDFSAKAYLLFFMCLILSAILFKNSLFETVFVIRLYLISILVYLIAKYNVSFNKRVVKIILKFTLTFYSFVALWGIFQALVLGDDFLIHLGYPLSNGRLADSYYFGGFGDMQRVVSTFSNTNVFGFVIGILLLIMLFNPTLVDDFKGKKYCLIILGLAFILTFSRSNWVAMTIILLLSIRKNKSVLKSVVILLSILILFAFLYYLFSGINMFDILQKYIMNTITMKEDSAAGRTGIWITGITTFFRNPFGIGLGKVGMVSKILSGEIKVIGESSYISILLDTGIQGALCYFSALLYIAYSTLKHSYTKLYAMDYLNTVRYIIIYLMIMFVFSNHIYDREIMIIAFFFIGLSRNKVFLDSN